MSAAAMLLCGGRGKRLGASIPKPVVPLAGRPLFVWSLEALHQSGAFAEIVIVGPVRMLRPALESSGAPPIEIAAWVEGGKERQDSVARGLAALSKDVLHVAVHDSARALLSPALVMRVVGDALLHGAAIAALPVADTLKRARLETIEDTIPRASLWRAQTPQAFRRDWLEEAHRGASGHATDDAALVEASGRRIHLTLGDPVNFKITTARDLELAEAWLTRAAARA